MSNNVVSRSSLSCRFLSEVVDNVDEIGFLPLFDKDTVCSSIRYFISFARSWR
jgi:hypothetical protein